MPIHWVFMLSDVIETAVSCWSIGERASKRCFLRLRQFTILTILAG